MPARTLGAAAITAALVLLPTAAHAAAPDVATPSLVSSAERGGHVVVGSVVAGPSEIGSTGSPSTSLVVLGLVTLVGGALILVLVGRRPDDDEPAD